MNDYLQVRLTTHATNFATTIIISNNLRLFVLDGRLIRLNGRLYLRVNLLLTTLTRIMRRSTRHHRNYFCDLFIVNRLRLRLHRINRIANLTSNNLRRFFNAISG